MTQRDPDPASLPEATPLLSYERQMDDGAMAWVVRFIGAWAICNGAVDVLDHVIRLINYDVMFGVNFRDPQRLGLLASLLFGLTLVGFGIAIARRSRAGFHGSLIALVVAPMFQLGSAVFAGAGQIALFLMTSLVVPATALFAVLLSVLRRADARGALRPLRARPPETRQDANNIGFLISRLGWLYLADGSRIFVDFAMMALGTWAGTPTPLWSWQTGIQVAMYLALGACGLLLCQRRVWALWFAAGILPMRAIIEFLVMRLYYSPIPIPSEVLVGQLPSVLGTAANVFMLCILARKTARTGM